jgi:protein-S-isoprenylcysteine O-methyltransferase Ste14
MINQILTYGYIIIFVISLVIRFLLKNNICLLSNDKLCQSPETKLLSSGDIAYSCENAKIYKPVILSSFFKFIRNIMYFVLICAIIAGSFLLLIENDITKKASFEAKTLLVVGYVILLLQLIIWFIITTYCKGNNYTCNIDVKLLSENELSEFKYFDVNCVSNIKQSKLLNWLVSLYWLYDKLLILILVITVILLLVLLKFVKF